MRTTHAARLRACLPLGVLLAFVAGAQLCRNAPPVAVRPLPTSGDAGLFQYYTDVEALMSAGKEMEAVIALGDAPAAPIRLNRARKLPLFARGADPGALILRIAEGLERRTRESAAVKHWQKARIYALHCRALAFRLQAAAASDAESRALAARVQRLADGAARIVA